jgi:hypothetical protein
VRLQSHSTGLKVAIAGVLVSVGALALLLYVAPSDYRDGWWGFEPGGARMYLEAAGLSLDISPLGRATFIWTFRALLILAWLSWLVAIASAYRGARLTRAWAATVVIVPTFVLALVGPPVLSFDVFGYVSYGRLVYLHGLNPYENGRAALELAGDPSASFLFAPGFVPYGPVWPLLVAALGPIGSLAGLFGEVLVHKLLAATALIVTAAAGARVAGISEPGRGQLTLLAIGLNPLFLIEGAVGGHNDMLAVALLMCAAAFSVGSRHRLGALSVGLAIATKATALGVLPLILFDRWIHVDRQRRAREMLSVAALTVGPVIALSYVFGGPGVLVGVVRERVGIVGPAGPAAWLGRGLLLAAVVWGFLIIRSRNTAVRESWITAWVVVSAAIILTSTTLRFPWYLMWPLAPALVRWDERHRILITGAAVCSVLVTWLYTVGR